MRTVAVQIEEVREDCAQTSTGQRREMDRDEGKYLATSFSLYAGSDGSNSSLAFGDSEDDLALLWTRVFCILQREADGG